MSPSFNGPRSLSDPVSIDASAPVAVPRGFSTVHGFETASAEPLEEATAGVLGAESRYVTRCEYKMHEARQHIGLPSPDVEGPYITVSSLKRSDLEGWAIYTHPRGCIYFRHEQTKVIIDQDNRIPANLEKANAFCAEHPDLAPWDDTEVHLTFGVDAAVCLFVNHKQCAASYDVQKLRYDSLANASVDARGLSISSSC